MSSVYQGQYFLSKINHKPTLDDVVKSTVIEEKEVETASCFRSNITFLPNCFSMTKSPIKNDI